MSQAAAEPKRLIDRALRMMEMAGYALAPLNAEHNNPIIAWMADARAYLSSAVSERVAQPITDHKGRPMTYWGGKKDEPPAPPALGTPRVCVHPLARRPILYTDSIKGEQVCRDDLWAVTTDELNDIAAAKRDAERWRVLVAGTSAERPVHGQYQFRPPRWLMSATTVNLLKGSVVEHLNDAADAALAAKGAGT